MMHVSEPIDVPEPWSCPKEGESFAVEATIDETRQEIILHHNEQNKESLF